MKKLKKMIVGYMRKITFFMVIIILLLSVGVEMLAEQRQARESGQIIFRQITHILEKNREELQAMQEEGESENGITVMEKNELSYIFSLLRVNPGITFIAIDKESGEIVGCTDEASVGKKYEEIGLDIEKAKRKTDGFHEEINGVNAYCIFSEIDGNYVGRIVPASTLYARVPNSVLWNMVCLILIAIILVAGVSGYMNKYVVTGIYAINEKLREITKGNWDETVDVQTSVEFSELSSHVNEMVNSLLANTEKMSYVLARTNMRIGVYEHNEHMKNVRFTKYITELLSLQEEELSEISADYQEFRKYIEQLRRYPISGEEGVYLVEAESDIYVKIEETVKQGDTLGIVIDVTDMILKRRQIEAERDLDILSGLNNRRGLRNKLSELFEQPEKLLYSAMIMIDADGLKGINDKYGHEKGDEYLRGVAELLGNLDNKHCVVARLGGDEFVVFMYHYEIREDLLEAIRSLQQEQEGNFVNLDEELRVPLQFSLGFCLKENETNYDKLLKKADTEMYKNKAERKQR